MLERPHLVKLRKNVQNPQFQNQAELIKCLGDPTCLKMLFILSHGKVLCPSDFRSVLNISMPAISHHLLKLKQMGILTSERMGQSICYSFSDSKKAVLIKKLVNEVVS